MNDAQDVPRWGHLIAMTPANREDAFATAAEVRRMMAEQRTWAMAAGGPARRDCVNRPGR